MLELHTNTRAATQREPERGRERERQREREKKKESRKNYIPQGGSLQALVLGPTTP